MQPILIIILGLFSTHALSSSWNCQNSDLEILCSSSKCKASDTFTPFDVSINDNGELSICAYSGCWKGNGTVMKSGKHILLSATKIRWTGTSSSTADFIIAVDTGDKVGFIKGEGFAMPTTCSQKTE